MNERIYPSNMNDMAFATALLKIIDRFGISTLLNENQTIALLSDISPQLKREKELLKQFYKCDGAKLLIDAKRITGAQQETQKQKVAKLLVENYWVADTAAHYVCDLFWYAIPGEMPTRGVYAEKTI